MESLRSHIWTRQIPYFFKQPFGGSWRITLEIMLKDIWGLIAMAIFGIFDWNEPSVFLISNCFGQFQLLLRLITYFCYGFSQNLTRKEKNLKKS